MIQQPGVNETPEFPLLVKYFDKNGNVEEEVIIETPRNPETELEFFDSEGEDATVTDAQGRPVVSVRSKQQ